MTTRDLHALPRFRDGLSFLYVEHVRIEQDQHAIVLLDAKATVPVPVASLSVLMLGPGSTITHAAMLALADNGCSVVWCGEGAVRFYAAGGGETKRAANLLAQAKVWADEEEHLKVVHRLYRMRFSEAPAPGLTLEQLRGMEGVRVRETYAQMSRETGIKWSGRAYRPGEWGGADPVNRALSTANACLYGVCHAAIVSTGFSPGLGFIHSGKMLAFVYDVADLYKCAVTIPVAFEAARDDWNTGFEARVRRLCRQAFWQHKLLERIVPDIQEALGLRREAVEATALSPVEEVGDLWDSVRGCVKGGHNWADAAGTDGHAEPDEPSVDDDEGIPF